MNVLVADRKNKALKPKRSKPAPPADGEARVLFMDVLRTATVLMLALPITSESYNLISTDELALMRPDAVIVNVRLFLRLFFFMVVFRCFRSRDTIHALKTGFKGPQVFKMWQLLTLKFK